VVLTPAVFAAARKARADPLPLLFICALVANAASFVLPISNPANLVLYGAHTPPLMDWMRSFALPSILSIVATYGALQWAQRRRLAGACEPNVDQPRLTAGGWTALGAIAVAAVILVSVSALDIPLGFPTCLLGIGASLAVLIRDRASPVPLLKGVSWSVLPLVAGLFVLVEGLARTGLVARLGQALSQAWQTGPATTAAGAGVIVSLASNLINNLPAGLVASFAIQAAHAPKAVVDSLLIGVDLGPNLSVTGSLATILWLTAIRREGEQVGFWQFIKVGALVMPPALLLALGARLAF
jgi:arsenical pump membrane protein